MECLLGPPRAFPEDSCPSPTSQGPDSSWRGSGSQGSDSSPCPQHTAQGHTGWEGGRKCSQGMEATMTV